jgi:hypothetical protein
MKKLAVLVSGWHFPLHFYKAIAEQQIPPGWSVDLFCISHRDPHYSLEEKKESVANLGSSYAESLDKVLYEKIATVEEIEALSWNYKLYPNTVGDFGNTNQWLEEHDYKQYDVLLASHDDNFILNDRLYVDLLAKDPSWLILTNSKGSLGLSNWKEFVKVNILKRPINVRGSFEFFKKEIFDMLGGKFDLTGVTLSREGNFLSPKNFKSINNWNMVVAPLRKFLEEHHLASRVVPISNTYRVSDYCIEGERGFISSIRPEDKVEVLRGLRRIEKKYGTRFFSNK